jgi:hypothetical protein
VYRMPPNQPLPEDFAKFSWGHAIPTVLDWEEERDPKYLFTFTARAWEPTEKPRVVVRRELRTAFEDQLTAYLDRMEALARARRFIRAAQKVGRHFEWLALYQVGGRTPAQIAQQFGKERQAVDTAIRQTAEMIDLTIRPLPHGGARPKRQTRTVIARRPKT